MPPITLVTDSSADLPPEVLAEGGLTVVLASFAFDEHSFADGDLSAADFYRRMSSSAHLPRPFGAPEAAYRTAFEAVLAAGGDPFCLVTPFDVLPSFTTAVAAMLSLDDVDMKVLNPGVASAGLCSLLVTLAAAVRSGATRQQLLDGVDRLGPRCDTLFVPAGASWLERAGRLQLIEDRLGEVGDGFPVLRVGTRVTGVALEDSFEAAIRRAVSLAGQRGGAGTPLVVTVDHADNPKAAESAAQQARASWQVERLIVTELSAAIGSQLGPGAVGIGVAPASLEEPNA